MRQLRQSVTALESFISNHLQYHRADDVRMVNSVMVHFDSLVTRLVYSSTDIMDRYQLTRHGRLVVHEKKRCQSETEHVDVLLAADLSTLLSHITTASQLISLAA